MVGGFSFERSKFNRATQALPAGRLVVQADRLHRRHRSRLHAGPSILMDTPASFPAGPNQPPYSPQNYDHKFEGPDHAAARARTVAQRPGGAGDGRARTRRGHRPTRGVSASNRRFPPYLPVALGAAEATLMEMTSVYAVFPNQGVRMQRLRGAEGVRSRRQRARRRIGPSRRTPSAPTRRT